MSMINSLSLPRYSQKPYHVARSRYLQREYLYIHIVVINIRHSVLRPPRPHCQSGKLPLQMQGMHKYSRRRLAWNPIAISNAVSRGYWTHPSKWDCSNEWLLVLRFAEEKLSPIDVLAFIFAFSMTRQLTSQCQEPQQGKQKGIECCPSHIPRP